MIFDMIIRQWAPIAVHEDSSLAALGLAHRPVFSA